VAFSALSAAGLENEPRGLGQAEFGSSVEQVRTVHPQMEEIRGAETIAAPAVHAPNIRRFVLRQQKLSGTDVPITVELRFWKDRFWLYITSFEAGDRERVFSALTRRHGPPDRGGQAQPIWAGNDTTILGEIERGWFTTQSQVIGRQTQTWFTDALDAAKRPKRLRRKERGSGPTPPPPAADAVPASSE
jgi:hypothetical protein